MKTPAQKVQDATAAVAHAVNNNLAELQGLARTSAGDWAQEIVEAVEVWGRASQDFLSAPWEPETHWTVLDYRVLAVATTRIEGTWTAYVGCVAGQNHAKEFRAVLQEGTKLPEKIARALFGHLPEFGSAVPFAS